MEVPELIEAALGLSALEDLSERSRRQIVGAFCDTGEITAFSAGDPLTKQGGIGGDAGFVLMRGEVVIEQQGEAPLTVSAPALLGEMSQWNPRAQRVATVTCRGPAEVLRFSWREAHARAQERLDPADHARLMEAIERIALQRFQREDLLDLPLLRALPAELRLRICILLQWVARPLQLGADALLFETDALCDDTGYLILQGEIAVSRFGEAPRVIAAPDLIGIHPQFDPDLRWRATARALTRVEVLRFAWRVFLSLLDKRMSAEERKRFQAMLHITAADERLAR